MKRITQYCYLLCILFIGFACTEEDDGADDTQIDESLLYGEWTLTEARGHGDFTSNTGESGTFLFISEESDASLTFPSDALAGAVYRDGAVTGAMTYDPGNLGYSQDTEGWDNMLPNGAWTLTGVNFHVEGGIYGDFDGIIDELTEDTFIITGTKENITAISNPGGNTATFDGIWTFTFEK